MGEAAQFFSWFTVQRYAFDAVIKCGDELAYFKYGQWQRQRVQGFLYELGLKLSAKAGDTGLSLEVLTGIMGGFCVVFLTLATVIIFTVVVLALSVMYFDFESGEVDVEDEIVITVDDLGNAGEGAFPSNSVARSLFVRVAPVNDPPFIHVPGAHVEYVHDEHSVPGGALDEAGDTPTRLTVETFWETYLARRARGVSKRTSLAPNY